MSQGLKMKVCNKCQKEKLISDFGKYRNKCKECYNLAKTEHYKKTREMMSKFLMEFYDNELCCENCMMTSDYGISFFEWHHKDPRTKENHISNMLGVNNKEKLLEELDKCICLCPNCHKNIHLDTWGSATRWDRH